MPPELLRTALEDVVLLRPQVFQDDRGLFFESFNARDFRSVTGIDVDFVQDNHSASGRNVVRGLHYQVQPHPQGKLVRCTFGAVFDVAVDIRRSSPSFGRWTGHRLDAENKLQLWVPAGFAHGFVALTERADLLYKTTSFFSADCDRSIRWNDPSIGIDWPLDGSPILSDKDRSAALLAQAEVFD